MMSHMKVSAETGAAVQERIVPRGRPWGLLGVAAVLLLAWTPGIGERFGPSYEGYTGAVWGSAVEAVEDFGWLDSRAGTVRRDEVYANHPPLLTAAVWGSALVLGDGHWQMRAAAIAASLGAVALLYALCRRLGASRVAAVAGAAVAALSPMMLGNGSMVDTWVLGFPLGLAVLLTLADGRTDGWRVAAAVACALCSWQGVILAALSLPVAVARFGLRSRYVLALLGGVVGVFLFMRWAGTPSNGVTIGWPFDGQSLVRLRSMLGLALVLVPFALLTRDRTVALVAIGAPVAYGLLFTFHADWHDFWMLWLLTPVALGTTVLVDRFGRVGWGWVGAVAAVGLLCAGAITPDRRGEVADSVVVATDGLGQPWLPIVDGQPGTRDEAWWVGYETGMQTHTVELDEVPQGWTFLALNDAGPECEPVVEVITICRGVRRPRR